MNETTLHEHVSALADGQLGGEELPKVLDRLCAHHELRECWRTWHLVGDVLRTGRHVPCSDTDRFVMRLQQRLAAEPQQRLPATEIERPGDARAEAANEPVWRWKVAAGLASMAAVAAIGWNWIGGAVSAAPGAGAQLSLQTSPPPPRQDERAGAPVVAGADASTRASGPPRAAGSPVAPAAMLRDARLDEMLAAHQQAGGVSQMPSSFLRNATFESPAR